MALEDVLTGFGGRSFPLPSIAGAYKGRSLIVCGDAACIWKDLEVFGARSNEGRGKVAKDGWNILCVNKIVELLPGNIEHVYSNEPWLLDKFIAARRSEYKREFSPLGHTHSCNKGAQWRWPWSGRGSSLLGATLVGLGLGYEQIVICGGPLDDGPHNGEPPWRKCEFKGREVRDNAGTHHWKLAIATVPMTGRVYSMSGRTLDWLGAPPSSILRVPAISSPRPPKPMPLAM